MSHNQKAPAQPRKPFADRAQYWFMVGHDIKLCRTEFRSTQERVRALLTAAVRAGAEQ